MGNIESKMSIRWKNPAEKRKIIDNLENWIVEKFDGAYRLHCSNFSVYVQSAYTNDHYSILRISDHIATNMHTGNSCPCLFLQNFDDLRQLKKAIVEILDCEDDCKGILQSQNDDSELEKKLAIIAENRKRAEAGLPLILEY